MQPICREAEEVMWHMTFLFMVTCCCVNSRIIFWKMKTTNSDLSTFWVVISLSKGLTLHMQLVMLTGWSGRQHLAWQRASVVLVCEDTDLPILLWFHITPLHSPISFHISEILYNKINKKVWSIQAVKAKVGTEVCRQILFAHAFGGCDTNNSPYKQDWKIHLFEEIDGFNHLSAASRYIQCQFWQRIKKGDCSWRKDVLWTSTVAKTKTLWTVSGTSNTCK